MQARQEELAFLARVGITLPQHNRPLSAKANILAAIPVDSGAPIASATRIGQPMSTGKAAVMQTCSAAVKPTTPARTGAATASVARPTVGIAIHAHAEPVGARQASAAVTWPATLASTGAATATLTTTHAAARTALRITTTTQSLSKAATPRAAAAKVAAVESQPAGASAAATPLTPASASMLTSAPAPALAHAAARGLMPTSESQTPGNAPQTPKETNEEGAEPKTSRLRDDIIRSKVSKGGRGLQI